MKNLRIALDIDDVLAGFFPYVCEKFDRPEVKCDIWDGVDVNRWIVEGWKDIEDDVNFWETMPSLSRANSIDFEVACYITYSPESLVEVRRDWLKRHGFPEAPIINTKDKLQTMKDENIDVIIEDKVTTVNTINSTINKIALQFKPPYMTKECNKPERIITHLSEVKPKLEEIFGNQVNMDMLLCLKDIKRILYKEWGKHEWEEFAQEVKYNEAININYNVRKSN